jgi:hypothetical protein
LKKAKLNLFLFYLQLFWRLLPTALKAMLVNNVFEIHRNKTKTWGKVDGLVEDGNGLVRVMGPVTDIGKAQ